MTEKDIIRMYMPIYEFWSENCDKLKDLPSGEYRSRIVDINVGLVFAMNQIASLFHFATHKDFNDRLKEIGKINE